MQIQLDIRVMLVILQKNIVVRLVLLDQVSFQTECFKI